MIRFEDVNEENWRIPLAVSDEQRRWVADSTCTLARAYAYRGSRSRAYIIYNDDTPVGMGLYYDDPDNEEYIFSELFIDYRYQRQGFGRAAVKLTLDAMKADGRYNKVALCYVEGNATAKRLYEGFGFKEADRDGDEIDMELVF